MDVVVVAVLVVVVVVILVVLVVAERVVTGMGAVVDAIAVVITGAVVVALLEVVRTCVVFAARVRVEAEVVPVLVPFDPLAPPASPVLFEVPPTCVEQRTVSFSVGLLASHG